MIMICRKNIIYNSLCSVPCLLFVLFLMTGIAAGRDLFPQQIAEKMQEAYDKTTSFAADFRQVTTLQMGRRQRHGAGTVVIQKPGRIRWDYKTPDIQVLISDGTTFSMYFANSAQMIIKPVSEHLAGDVTYDFFTGSGNIVRDFKVFAADDDFTTAGYCVKLVPNDPHPQVDYLHLCAGADDFLIKRMQIVDLFGTVTDLYFSNIRVNQSIDPDIFSFVPPPDTEIIGDL